MGRAVARKKGAALAQPTIDALDDGCLTEIFLHIRQPERLTTLALVNKRWAGLVRSAGPLWRTLRLSPKLGWDPAKAVDAQDYNYNVLSWLRSRLPVLEDLDINAWQVQREDADLNILLAALIGATALRDLTIYSDAFHSTDIGSLQLFVGLTSLIVGEFLGAPLAKNLTAVICRLPNLEDLSLGFMPDPQQAPEAAQACPFPTDVTKLTRLKTLHFNATPHGLLDVGGMVQLPASLELLVMCNCHVTSLESAKLGRLTELTELILLETKRPRPEQHLPHSPLPAATAQLTQLQRLALSAVEVPMFLGSLSQLEFLMIDQAKISEAAFKQLSALTSLTGLQLQHCQDVGDHMTAFVPPPSLCSLGIENCKLTGLPAPWRVAAQLEELSLAHNRFVAIPDGLRTASKLARLDMSFNPRLVLPTTQTDPLQDVPGLEQLSVRRSTDTWTTKECRWLADKAQSSPDISIALDGDGAVGFESLKVHQFVYWYLEK